MKGLRKILWFFLGLLTLLLLFSLWYSIRYSMDRVEPYQINSPDFPTTLLIATQGSDFKNKITKAVINQFKSDSIYIKVIDVGSLAEIKPEDFNAILIMHTWEKWKPPAEVKSFIDSNKKDAYKMVVLTTSGQGSSKMEGVDAITGESAIKDVPFFTDRIVERLKILLVNTN